MDATLQKLTEIEKKLEERTDRLSSIVSRQLAELKTVVEELTQHTDDRAGATARAVSRLAEGLRKSAELQSNDLDQMRQAILELTAVVGPRDVTRMTGERLADFVTLETASRARNVLWARKRGEPDPLPALPPAGEGAPIAIAADNSRRNDDSITFKRGRDGDTRLQISAKTKTLWAWIVAAVAGGMHLVRLVIDHWPRH